MSSRISSVNKSICGVEFDIISAQIPLFLEGLGTSKFILTLKLLNIFEFSAPLCWIFLRKKN